MRCIHPIIRKYLDIAGVEHIHECPCGKCIACLHNSQDSWSFRCLQTCESYKDFIYDTLTFSPSGISYRNVTDKLLSSLDLYNDVELSRHLNYYQHVDRGSGEIMQLVPVIDRSVIRNWIRRGKELFVYHNHYRPKIKYFICEEYGPKTSRPHIHLLCWGLSRADYVRFFAKPWRRMFGFTRTKFIQGGTVKDRECICRYISKYVSKGVFESPLVKSNLVPKPFRSISHGLGEEYIDKVPLFKFFSSWRAEWAKSIGVDSRLLSGEILRTSYLRLCIKDNISEGLGLEKYFSLLSRYLTTWYDSLGHPHPLPRYYKNKLADMHRPNLLSYALQTYLLEDARVQYNKGIQEYAHSLGYIVADKDPKSETAGFDSQLYHLLCRGYFVAQRVQAKTEAKRRYIRLKNHYGRALNLQGMFVN